MQIKRFSASNIYEAMKLVRAEFGSDAVIFSTRNIKGNGVEVTAAADREGARYKNIASIPNVPHVPHVPPHPGPDSILHRELKELKDLMSTMVNQKQREDFLSNNKTLSELQEMMVSIGIDENLSYKVLQSLSERLSSEEANDRSVIVNHLKEFIMKQVSVAEIVENGHGPKVVMFVGPTGVGKTTTIAKLAAINAIKKKKKVALVTLDTYRIAAVEQLKVYARIMGIPVHVVANHGDFAKTVAGIKGADLIFVDTAGRGQKDKTHMEELRRIFDTGITLETHLVLSATAKEKDMMDVIRRFKNTQVDRLLFTKLDETTTYGGIFNAIVVFRKPVSYLTTGQRVPEDIEPATPLRVAKMILNEVSDEE